MVVFGLKDRTARWAEYLLYVVSMHPSRARVLLTAGLETSSDWTDDISISVITRCLQQSGFQFTRGSFWWTTSNENVDPVSHFMSVAPGSLMRSDDLIWLLYFLWKDWYPGLYIITTVAHLASESLVSSQWLDMLSNRHDGTRNQLEPARIFLVGFMGQY